MDIVEEIKQKTDIVDVIGRYTSLKKAGKIFTGLCPFHEEKHGSFVVYPDQQSWHCFGACGTGGDIISFIEKKENLTFPEALQFLADQVGVVIPSKAPVSDREANSRIISANELAVQFFNDQLNNSLEAQIARDYLSKRGLTAQSIAHFRLGYSPKGVAELQKYLGDHGYTKEEMLAAGLINKKDDGTYIDRFRGRLMFPIRNIKGQTVGFGARTLDNSLPKYLNSADTPVFSKGSLLYGLDFAKDEIRKQDRIVIVEGYMDVIMPHQFGYTNVVASMGTAIGPMHCSIIKKLTKNIILALDADQAGEQGMIRTVPLENDIDNEIRMVTIPEGKDPDELMLKDSSIWPSLIDHAEPLVDHIFTLTFSQLDMNSVAGKSAAVDKLCPILSNINNPIRQMIYVDKLASTTGIDKNAIINRLNQNKVVSYSTQPVEKQKVSSSIASRPVESFGLSILIRHPEIIDKAEELKEEYLVNTENKEILRYLRGEIEELNPLLKPYYEELGENTKADGLVEDKLEEVILRLRLEFIKKSAMAAPDLAVNEGRELEKLLTDKEKLASRNRSYYGQKESS